MQYKTFYKWALFFEAIEEVATAIKQRYFSGAGKESVSPNICLNVIVSVRNKLTLTVRLSDAVIFVTKVRGVQIKMSLLVSHDIMNLDPLITAHMTASF